MPNSYFQFKQFTVHQAGAAMKVTTDSCCFGAWAAQNLGEGVRSLLDVGAGTGLLSLMICQQHELTIDAIEIDPEAAAQARHNISGSPWAARIHLIQENFLAMPPTEYDVVISNPPFYENELLAEAQARNLAHHGRSLTVSRLLQVLPQWLKPEGQFFLLLPAKRAGDLMSKMAEAGLFVHHCVWLSHSEDHPPMRALISGKRMKSNLEEKILYIREPSGTYTKEFTDLLRPYYLHL